MGHKLSVPIIMHHLFLGAPWYHPKMYSTCSTHTHTQTHTHNPHPPYDTIVTYYVHINNIDHRNPTLDFMLKRRRKFRRFQPGMEVKHHGHTVKFTTPFSSNLIHAFSYVPPLQSTVSLRFVSKSNFAWILLDSGTRWASKSLNDWSRMIKRHLMKSK